MRQYARSIKFLLNRKIINFLKALTSQLQDSQTDYGGNRKFSQSICNHLCISTENRSQMETLHSFDSRIRMALRVLECNLNKPKAINCLHSRLSDGLSSSKVGRFILNISLPALVDLNITYKNEQIF